MKRNPGLFLTGLALLAVLPVAQAQIYKVTLLGTNEIPVVNTAGTGSAIITLNGATHEMRVIASFSGLTSGVTASHVHCCVVQPANASVATTTPTFPGTPLGVTSGSWDRTYDMTQTGAWNAPFLAAGGGTALGAEAAFMTGVAAGQSYLNIHTTNNAGGELRGFLVLNRFAANTSLTRSAQGAAAALDSLGAGTGTLNNALVSLVALAPAPQAAAIAMLTPTVSNGAQMVVADGIRTSFDRVSDRLDGLRAAGGDQGPNSTAQGASGFWIMGNGVDASQGMIDGFAGYTNSGWGTAIGLDRRLQPGRYVGGALSYSSSSLDYQDQSAGDTAKIKNTQLSIYATQAAGPAFIDAIAAYGSQKYDTTRNTGVTGVAAGAYDGETLGVRLGAGLPKALSPKASITPQVRLDWDKIKQDGYTETGGGPMALAVATKSAKRFRASIGAQFDFFSDKGDVKVRPFLRGYFHHNFSNDGLDASASFVSGGTRFTTPVQEMDDNPYTVGAGVNIYSKQSFAAAITYDGTFSDSYHSHVYEAKLRWMF